MPTRQIAPPASPVVTLGQIKAHTRVTSTSEDDFLEACLAAAHAEIDGPGLLGRAMIRAQYEQISPAPRGRDLEIVIGPVLEVLSIETIAPSGARAFLDPLRFEVVSDGERAALRGAWPALAARLDAVTVVYAAGMSDDAAGVPAPLRHAVTLLAAHRFEVREEIIVGTILARVPMGVERLLDLYRVGSFG